MDPLSRKRYRIGAQILVYTKVCTLCRPLKGDGTNIGNRLHNWYYEYSLVNSSVRLIAVL